MTDASRRPPNRPRTRARSRSSRTAAFLRLWLSQAATQIGGNMVLFGLTVIVVDSTSSNTAVSLLILTFLVPAVLFSAVAGVYVDRIDRRLILIATNVLRGARVRGALSRRARTSRSSCCSTSSISTVTVFFAPGRAGDDPGPRAAQPAARRERHLHADPQRGVRPRLRAARSAGGQRGRARRRSSSSSPALYFLAAVFCFTLPASPPPPPTEDRPHGGLGVGEAEQRRRARRSASCAKGSPSSAPTGRSAGR